MKAIYWIGLFLAGALAAGAQAVPSAFNYQGVLRGGAWDIEPSRLRAAARLFAPMNGRATGNGFRIAATLDLRPGNR